MARAIYSSIIRLILKATTPARSIGMTNVLQTGLVKEMIIADILGRALIHSKRDADAVLLIIHMERPNLFGRLLCV